MPKLRTRKSAAKRIKVTGTGKLLVRPSRRSHLLTHKSTKQKRRLKMELQITRGGELEDRRMVPYYKTSRG